jgi:hypothetical protein
MMMDWNMCILQIIIIALFIYDDFENNSNEHIWSIFKYSTFLIIPNKGGKK